MLNTAKAAAYSGMLMLFPTMVVVTALLALVPEGSTMHGPDSHYVHNFCRPIHTGCCCRRCRRGGFQSAQLLFSALILSVFAGLGMMLSLMEGFRRAYGCRGPNGDSGSGGCARCCWFPWCMFRWRWLRWFWCSATRSSIGWWTTPAHDLRHAVLFFWRMVRWAIALVTSVTVLGALYHFGTRRKEQWFRVMPGRDCGHRAVVSRDSGIRLVCNRDRQLLAILWPFAAGIATLVWLYLTSFSALLGAELNGVLFRVAVDRRSARLIFLKRLLPGADGCPRRVSSSEFTSAVEELADMLTPCTIKRIVPPLNPQPSHEPSLE